MLDDDAVGRAQILYALGDLAGGSGRLGEQKKYYSQAHRIAYDAGVNIPPPVWDLGAAELLNGAEEAAETGELD